MTSIAAAIETVDSERRGGAQAVVVRNRAPSVVFTNVWQARYLRNNQSNGVKNLRCFPQCAHAHNPSGFCGRTIDIRVELASNDVADSVVLWGEIAQASAPPRWAEGDLVTDDEVRALLRTKGDVRPSLRVAKPSSSGGKTYKFEPGQSQLCGWSYAWVSSKHTSMTEHAFFVFYAQRVAAKAFRVAAVFHSPRFTVFCGRRPLPQTSSDGEDGMPLEATENSASMAPSHKRFKLHDGEFDASTMNGMLVRILSAVDRLDLTNANEQRLLSCMAPSDDSCPATSLRAGEHDWFAAVHDLLSPLDLSSNFEDVFESKPDALSGDVVVVLGALARHLVEETAFLSSIEVLQAERSFADFLVAIASGLSAFLAREFQMTIAELDAKLRGQQPSLGLIPGSLKPAFDNLVLDDSVQLHGVVDDVLAPQRARKLAAYDAMCPVAYSLEMLLDPRLNNTVSAMSPSPCGVWQRTSYDDVTRMREDRGMSPMLAKLTEQMESKFEVRIDGDDVVVRFNAKLASTVLVRSLPRSLSLGCHGAMKADTRSCAVVASARRCRCPRRRRNVASGVDGPREQDDAVLAHGRGLHVALDDGRKRTLHARALPASRRHAHEHAHLRGNDRRWLGRHGRRAHHLRARVVGLDVSVFLYIYKTSVPLQKEGRFTCVFDHDHDQDDDDDDAAAGSACISYVTTWPTIQSPKRALSVSAAGTTRASAWDTSSSYQ